MSPERPPRSLRGQAWFLTGVNGVFHVRNAVCMSAGSSISILKSLNSFKVPCLLGVLERPLRSLSGHAWFLNGVYGLFTVRYALCMSPGSSVPILKSLASLEVPHLLGVSRASSKKSKRTCLVPDCINFEVSSSLRSIWMLPYTVEDCTFIG